MDFQVGIEIVSKHNGEQEGREGEELEIILSKLKRCPCLCSPRRES